MPDLTKLREFIDALLAEEAHEQPSGEEWPALIRRLKGGRNERIHRGTYAYFQEVLPPHYRGGDFFAFCEGREPLRLFVHRGKMFLCRQLTWEQTVTFCTLAGIDLSD